MKMWEALDIAALVATMSDSRAQPAVAAQKHAGPGKLQQSRAILLLQRIIAGALFGPVCLSVHGNTAFSSEMAQT